MPFRRPDEPGRRPPVPLRAAQARTVPEQRLLAEMQARRHAEQALDLVRVVGLAVAGAPDETTALRETLRLIAWETDWNGAESWLPRGDRLVAGPLWHEHDDTLAAFHEAAGLVAIAPEEPPLGPAWIARRPLWLTDLARHGPTLRSGLAAEAGLSTVLALPVPAGDEVVAVLAVYARRARDEDPRLVQRLAAVTELLGVDLRRRRAEAARAQAPARIAAIAQGLPAAAFQYEMDDDGTARFAVMGDGIRDLAGIPPEAIVEDVARLYRIVLPQDLQHFQETLAAAVLEQRPWSCAFRVQMAGKARWLEGRAAPAGRAGGTARLNGLLIDLAGRAAPRGHDASPASPPADRPVVDAAAPGNTGDGATAGGPAAKAAPPLPRRAAILVVEDEPALLSAVARQLRSLGHEVIEAGDGPGALAALDAAPALDLLFTDVVLPGGVDGREIAAEALRRRPRLRVLLTSGYSPNVLVHRGALPADIGFLRKPYRRAALAEAVRKALAGPGTESGPAAG